MKPPLQLLHLPPELITSILRHVSPPELAQIARTCHTLRTIAYDDMLWQRHVAAHDLPAPEERCAPFGSWREMYATHYPYWFLPGHRLWFADRMTGHQEFIGQLALARYDYRMGNIEMYRLHAYRRTHEIMIRWPYNPQVVIFMFEPKVILQTADPVLRLEPGLYPRGPRLYKELDLGNMSERYERGMRSRLLLTRYISRRAMDTARLSPSPALWPPVIIPHDERVWTEGFNTESHLPWHYSQLCDTAFRTRIWSTSFSGAFGLRQGEEVATWSSLPLSAYTPTPEKPYQGIWVGDYHVHGLEFILITQKTNEEAAGIPPIQEMSAETRRAIGLYGPDAPPDAHEPVDGHQEEVDPLGYSGRLEAIKLTGDPHVRRGEYTFIAEDLGRQGLLRVAAEPPFEGARIVRSWGQVASRGFAVSGFMRSQLILASPDFLAQYWPESSHVSCFKRFDFEPLLDLDASSASCSG